MTSHISFQWHEHIDDIAESWAACFSAEQVLNALALHRAVESAGLDDVICHYLVGTGEQGPHCVIPCFSFRVSLVSLASPWMQKLAAGIRRLFPSFLHIRLFVVGSPLSTCGDLLGFGEHRAGVTCDDEALKAVFVEVTNKARALGIGLTLIKELTTALRDRLERAVGSHFLFVDSLPTTYLALPRTRKGGYLTAIRSKYRTKLKHRLTLGANSFLRWETTADLSSHSDEVYALYQQVLHCASAQFERLNREFFVNAVNALPGRCFMLLGFAHVDGAERMVACELVLYDQTILHPIYSGFDYVFKEQSALYFNTFYRLIEEAERRGCQALHIGQTAYEVKAELGALAVPLFLAVHHPNSVVRRILRWARGLLFPRVSVPYRAVFSQPADAYRILTSLKIPAQPPPEEDQSALRQ